MGWPHWHKLHQQFSPMPKLTRIPIAIAVAAFCVGLPYLLANHEDEASKVPAQWNLDYRESSIRQIVDQLGPPQESLPEKQFMNWTVPALGGIQVLRVSCQQVCGESERPAEVQYLFYRKRDERPARWKSLLQVQQAGKGTSPPASH